MWWSVSQLFVGLVTRFDIIEINECLVAKILLTNVTNMNKHSNFARFVHTLLCSV